MAMYGGGGLCPSLNLFVLDYYLSGVNEQVGSERASSISPANSTGISAGASHDNASSLPGTPLLKVWSVLTMHGHSHAVYKCVQHLLCQGSGWFSR